MWGSLFNLENPLIGVDNVWMTWAVVAVCVALAIQLEQTKSWAAKVGGPIILIAMGLVLANCGVISMSSPVWDVIFGYIVPLSIPLLLLQCDIRKIGKESGRLLIIYLIGAVGTSVGAMLAYGVFKDAIPETAKVAGAFTGTYTGGSVNFAMLASALDLSETMQSSALVADNLIATIYFIALLIIPASSFFRKHYKHPHIDEVEKNGAGTDGETLAAAFWRAKEISLKDIALGVATAMVIVAASITLGNILGEIIPTNNVVLEILNTFLGNQWIWIATFSMSCATLKPNFFGQIRGTQELGSYLIYMFFFTVAVPASVVELLKNAPLLFLFAAIIIIVNMAVCLIIGKILHFDLENILIASNANIGGPTTAAAMAISKGWTSLIGPSILVGTLGYVIGTYLGLLVGSVLGL